MTLVQDSVAPVSAADRAERLTTAGAAWAERIAANPESAELTFRVSGRGIGSVASEITAGRHTFIVDEPAALGGDDAGTSPVEYALGALISCQIVVYRLYAQVLGIQLDDIQITAEGDVDVRKLFGIDESRRAGFGDVRLVVKLDGPESPERYQELQAAVDAHCPVLDIFANPVPVSIAID